MDTHVAEAFIAICPFVLLVWGMVSPYLFEAVRKQNPLRSGSGFDKTF
jgi:hypothetical protein